MKVTFSVDKEKEFPRWYEEILLKAGICDVRYPCKGMPVYPPYGFKLMDLIFSRFEDLLLLKGYAKAWFPTPIPLSLFKKEAEHIKGFFGQVFWIERGGESKIEPKVLAPTSETAMYHMFSLWVKSYKDLPLKVYQRKCVYRYETKATKPLIRVREIPWIETHEVYRDEAEAKRWLDGMVQEYRRIIEGELGIPCLILKRPDWDKFPGAVYTIVADALMPNGKVLQIMGAHYLGTNFSKVFDIKFMDERNEYRYAFQTCIGISCRLVAALIGIHGDNHGLILPFNFAPIQCVIVPIPYKGEESSILDYAREVRDWLSGNGVDVFLDDDMDKTPGEKFYYWEMKGVPLRIEIGPNEVSNRTLTVVRRLDRKKLSIRFGDIDALSELAGEQDADLFKRARDWFKRRVKMAMSKEELRKFIGMGCIVKHPFCMRAECAQRIKDELNAEVRGVAYPEAEVCEGKCIICGDQARYFVYTAKSF